MLLQERWNLVRHCEASGRPGFDARLMVSVQSSDGEIRLFIWNDFLGEVNGQTREERPKTNQTKTNIQASQSGFIRLG